MLENSPDPYALTRDAYLQNQDFNAEIEEPEQFDTEEVYLDDFCFIPI